MIFWKSTLLLRVMSMVWELPRYMNNRIANYDHYDELVEHHSVEMTETTHLVYQFNLNFETGTSLNKITCPPSSHSSN